MSDQIQRIAVVTDDEKTISRHFGRAKYYLIFTVSDGQIVDVSRIEKPAHSHSHQRHHAKGVQVAVNEIEMGHGEAPAVVVDKFALLEGCDVLVTRGMGYGANNHLLEMNIRPVLTDIPRVEDAVAAVIDGSIVHHPEKLH